MMFFSILLVPLFLIYTYIFIKFTYGNEGKDERGQKILNVSYKYAAPIFPIGWLIVDLYHRYINALSLEVYRDNMLILLLLTFITQGMAISIYKKKL